MTKSIIALCAPFAIVASVSAAGSAKQFKIVGEKLSYRNVATVESQSDFETFTGKTNGVSGAIVFDPATGTGGGTVVIDVASIDTGIALRNEHLKSAGWMDTARYPNITFQTVRAQKVSSDSYKVSGKLTLHGVTKPVTATVRVRYRANGPETKKAGFGGDVIQVSTRFSIKLSDFGIVIPAMDKGKVSNEVILGVSAYAVAP